MILYSNNCPRCRVLKAELVKRNLKFEENDEFTDLIRRGFASAPILEINGEYHTFEQAMRVVKEM